MYMCLLYMHTLYIYSVFDSPSSHKLCPIPQALTVLQALGLARDEVLWLMKHILSPPPKGKHRPNMDDYVDNALPELLFYIVELKSESTAFTCSYDSLHCPTHVHV